MMSSLAIRLVRRGGLLQKKEGGGFSFANASLLYRSGIFGIGGFADATFLTGELYSGGGMAGLALRSSGGFRADLLGTAGVRHYQDWDEGLVVRQVAADITGQSDLGPGSATLPFAGVRAHLGYIFGRSRGGHFNLGAMTSLDWDLWRKHRRTQTIGGTNLVIGLTFGATIDLGG
jgi:hypothetical protein